MGKKRRILTSTTKFAKKYFEFLDKADGADDNVIDTSSGRGDPYIDTVNVVDNEDQTVTVSGRVFGMKATEKVEISVDGAAFGNEATVTVGGDGIDGVTYTKTIGVGDALSVGSHTFNVRKKDATDKDLRKSATADVRQNLINIKAAAFTKNGNQIRFTKAHFLDAEKPGKKAAGSGANAELGNFSFNIVVAKDGGANTPSLLTGVWANSVISKAEIGALGATVDILDTPGAGTYTFTVTPVDDVGVTLSDSAITFDVVV